MKIRNKFILTALFALLAGTTFVPGARAQYASRTPYVPSRFLLVFDTSSAMKKRLHAEDKAIHQLFALNLNGQFHAGDTIGLWLFGKDLQTGVYPLQHYEPEDVITIPSDISAFLAKQHYSRSTHFDELMPMLNRLVEHSERLTVIIFCDGDGQITGTTADTEINSTFRQNSSSMAKAKEPFIIVLRSQLGKFVGYTIGPAEKLNIPAFPPLPMRAITPEPAITTPKPVEPAPQPQPLPNAPPLIIIGSNVGTNTPVPTPIVEPAPAPQSQPTTSAAPVTPAPPVSSSLAVPTNPEPLIKDFPLTEKAPALTNAVVAAAEPTTPPMASAKVSVLPSENINPSKGSRFLILGTGLLVFVGIPAFLILRHQRSRHTTSLITESLKKR